MQEKKKVWKGVSVTLALYNCLIVHTFCAYPIVHFI